MGVLAFDGILLDGAAIMCVKLLVGVVVGIVSDGGAVFMDPHDALGIGIARLLIASFVGDSRGEDGSKVFIVGVVLL